MIDEIEEKPDFIVLDPPREGIHPKALPKIVDLYRCEKMLYISCKPTSLARDLVEFAKYGYRVEKVCCVDMFPGTVHVETVVLLSKGEIDSKKVRVEFSLEDMDMSGFQKGATYEQIKAYVLEHTGLKVSSLYISQIKRIPQNMPSLYSVQCNIYIVFQQLPFFRLFHLWTFRNQ